MTKGTKAFRITISALVALIVLSIVFIFFAVYYFDQVLINQENYGIFVAGIPVTRENQDDILGDGTVYYDSEYNILVFDGAEIESDQSIIASVNDLGVCLIGENKFISSSDGYIPLIFAVDSFLNKDLYIYGDGSLTIEYLNSCTDSMVIMCADLAILSDVTITMPDCSNITNGIVCDSSFMLMDGANVTINSGSAVHCSALRVRGNTLLEAGTAINVSIGSGSTDSVKGISINGDFIIGDGASVNISVEDDAATLVECIRVNGLLDVGVGATVTASTAKSYAVECYGSIKLSDDAVISAATEDGNADIICYGAVVNYGAAVNGEIEALGKVHEKSKE